MKPKKIYVVFSKFYKNGKPIGRKFISNIGNDKDKLKRMTIRDNQKWNRLNRSRNIPTNAVVKFENIKMKKRRIK